MNYEKVIAECKKYNIEIAAAPLSRTLFLICPKMPPKEVKEKIGALIPEGYQYEYKEAPKLRTRDILTGILSNPYLGSIRIELNFNDIMNKKMTLKLTGAGPITDITNEVWPQVFNTIRDDGYFEAWDIIINDKLVYSHNEKALREFAKNNLLRETVITNDDLTNLKIALESSRSFDEFLNTI